MDGIIDYFSNMPSTHRTMVLVGGLTFFFTIESFVPLFKIRYDRWKHLAINVFFTLTTILVNFSLAFILLKASDWVVESKIGVLQWVEMPLVLAIAVGLLLLDFIGAWLIHYIEHHVWWMWQFHVIHHTDQNVDTTTANRHHPGESVFRFVFTILAVIVAGAPIWLVFLYQSLSVVLSQFNHSNVSMPQWVDNAIMLVFCTPNMHRVHHHYRMPYSDSNYGNIFSFWDRIFKTFVKVDNTRLKYGLDTYMAPKEYANILEMLKMPFTGYRPSIQYDREEEL